MQDYKFTNSEARIALVLLEGIVNRTVESVRYQLSKNYPIDRDEPHKDYTGLCDVACDMLKLELEKVGPGEGMHNIQVATIHGEMKHSPICPSDHWCLQHTWAKVSWGGVSLYVDPTASQFKYIFKDIPDYYIGVEPPKWYYNDRKNPAFNGITRVINEKVMIRRKVPDPDIGHRYVKEGIIEFIQYDVWGRITDAIRKIKH